MPLPWSMHEASHESLSSSILRYQFWSVVVYVKNIPSSMRYMGSGKPIICCLITGHMFLNELFQAKNGLLLVPFTIFLKICYHHVKIQVLHFLWVISYRIRKNTHLPLPYKDKRTSWESFYYTPNLRKLAEHAQIFIWKSTSPIKYCLKLNNVGKNMQNCQQYKITLKIIDIVGNEATTNLNLKVLKT